MKRVYNVGGYALVFSAAVVMLVTTPAIHGQNAAAQSMVPDISGVWMVEKFQPALFPNGGAPLQPWAQAKFKAVNPETNDPKLGCLPDGVPRTMFVPAPMEVLQLPGRVLIIHEGIQVLRQIYMNRQHPEDVDPSYAGDSVGKWEGNTLVVDTIGLKDIPGSITADFRIAKPCIWSSASDGSIMTR